MEVKCIMKLIRSCIVSFPCIQKIPMPQFKWNDDDMKLHAGILSVDRSCDWTRFLCFGNIYTLILEWRISAMYA